VTPIVKRATFYVTTQEVVTRTYEIMLDPDAPIGHAHMLTPDEFPEPEDEHSNGEEVLNVVRKDSQR
jgi:hypothetical protein